MTFTNCGAAFGFIFAVIGLTAHAARADYLYASVPVNNETVYQIGPTGTVTDLVDSSSLSGLTSSRGEIASDGAGNLYALTGLPQFALELAKLGHGGATFVNPVPSIDSFNRLLTSDHAGNVYLYNSNADNLTKIDSNGVVSEVAFPILIGAGAADQNGNLFVSGASGSKSGILEIAPSGTVTLFSTGVTSPGQLAVDSSDDVFVYNNTAPPSPPLRW